MKTTFKLSFFALLLLSIFTITSCDDELDIDCEDFEVSLSYELDTIGGTEIIANITGGTSGFSYLWSEGSTTPSIHVFEDGTYTVTITDANDCTAVGTFTVTSNSSPPCDSLFSLALTTVYDPIGEYTVTSATTGGIAPYTYAWSNGANTPDITTDQFGPVSLTVTDSNGCTAIQEVVLDQVEPCDNFDGYLYEYLDSLNNDIPALGIGFNGFGTAPYTFLWNTGSTEYYIHTNEEGTYSVTVTDDNGCTFTAIYEYTLIDPCDGFDATIIASIDSFGQEAFYSLSVDITNGMTPTDYQWSNGDTTPEILVNINGGGYSVTVTNENPAMGLDCEATAEIQL